MNFHISRPLSRVVLEPSSGLAAVYLIGSEYVAFLRHALCAASSQGQASGSVIVNCVTPC